jgi:glucan-binding YG repeat protein
MAEGWNLVDGKWYFVEGGKLVTNQWKRDSIGWCLLGDDGAMLTNTWTTDSDGWCYIGPDGYCVTGTYTIDGVDHNFDSEGNWLGEA